MESARDRKKREDFADALLGEERIELLGVRWTHLELERMMEYAAKPYVIHVVPKWGKTYGQS